MNASDIETTLKFLVDRLDPADKADLEAILGGEEIPSVAEDVMSGRLRIAADAMPDSLRRQIRAKTRPDHSAANEEYAKQFPNAGRLK